MTGNIDRSALNYIKKLLKEFPCVVVFGARQVGKSTLLKQLLPDSVYVDLENPRDFDRILMDPMFFLDQQPQPLILDEIQLFPQLFSCLRVKIDQNRKKNGQYLISGSSSLELIKGASESLAGRVALVNLETFSWNEAAQKKDSLFFNYVAKGQWKELLSLKKRYTLDFLYDCCFYGGYPDPYIRRKSDNFSNQWMQHYVKTYIERDIRQLFPKLDSHVFRRFIQLLAFSNGQQINYSTFARTLDVSQPTIKSYMGIAEGTYMWKTLPSFDYNPHKQLQKMPKGFFQDSGLVCFLLQIPSLELLFAHPQYGSLHESFVISHILKTLQWTDLQVKPSYYRTRNGSEVDLVLSGWFGHLPIEIKSGSTVTSQKLLGLKQFMSDYKSPIGLLINQADSVEMVAPNILQIPITYL